MRHKLSSFFCQTFWFVIPETFVAFKLSMFLVSEFQIATRSTVNKPFSQSTASRLPNLSTTVLLASRVNNH